MRQKLCFLLALALVLMSGPNYPQRYTVDPLRSDPGMRLPLDPQLYGVAAWRAGESSEYVIVTHQDLMKEVKKLRFAVLSEEARGQVKFYTVESQVTELNVDRHTTINSVVRPFGDLTFLLEGATGEFVTKQDDDRALAVPIPLLRERFMLSRATAPPSKIISVETFGEESIKTRAGKLKTMHQRLSFADGRAAEVWWSAGIGPLGLVKVVSKGFSLDLLSHQSRKSVSAITEVPRSIVAP
ncbi:MAG: hypothetical protein LAO31_09550 [Acidobacteriia bacterium]|nr:hypothetical protein [Terriglobia bacterium]